MHHPATLEKLNNRQQSTPEDRYKRALVRLKNMMKDKSAFGPAQVHLMQNIVVAALEAEATQEAAASPK